jgi:hypothetical protein
VLVTLQYLTFGAHLTVLGTRWVFKRIGVSFVRLIPRSKEPEPAEREKHDHSPRPTTDIAKDKVVGCEEKETKNKSSMSTCSEMYHV